MKLKKQIHLLRHTTCQWNECCSVIDCLIESIGNDYGSKVILLSYYFMFHVIQEPFSRASSDQGNIGNTVVSNRYTP